MEVFEEVKTVNGQTIFAVFVLDSKGVKVPDGYMVNKGGRRFATLDLACEEAKLTDLERASPPNAQSLDSDDSDARSGFRPKR